MGQSFQSTLNTKLSAQDTGVWRRIGTLFSQTPLGRISGSQE